MTNTEPLTLSVAETARRLQLGTRTVYRAVAAGKLPALHFGRAIRIPKAALAQYLADAYRPTAGQRESTAE